MVMPFISAVPTPAVAATLNSEQKLVSGLESTSNSRNSTLIADRYDGDYDRYRQYRDDDRYRRYRNDDRYRRSSEYSRYERDRSYRNRDYDQRHRSGLTILIR